jgi:L-asparaginase
VDLHQLLSAQSRVSYVKPYRIFANSLRIYSAGGTILSASNYSRIDNINYGSGLSPTPADLIGNATEILNVAQLAIVRFSTSGGSSGANSSLFLNITQHANRQLCAEDSDIAGAIMFHGTNTLEETVCIHLEVGN